MPFRALTIVVEIYKHDAPPHEPNRYSIVTIINNRYNIRKAVRKAVICMYQEYRRPHDRSPSASWLSYGRQVARELHNALHRRVLARYMSVVHPQGHQQVQSTKRVRDLLTDTLLVHYDVDFDIIV